MIFLAFVPFLVGSCALSAHDAWSRRRRRAVGGVGSIPDTPVAASTEIQPFSSTQFSSTRFTSTQVMNWLEPRSKPEAALFRELKLVSAGVGLGVGGLFFFPLRFAGILCMAPTIGRIGSTSYRHLFQDRRFSADVATSIFVAGALIGGFFFALNVGGFFFVLVKWLGIKTEAHSREGIADLFGQHSRTAWVIVDGVEVEVPLQQVQVGALVAVQGGQTIPTDGIVVEGNASVDQHKLTGESQPVEKGPGDRALAATMVRSGRVVIRVEKAGEETTAAQIARMLNDTSDYTASLSSRADALNDKLALPFAVGSALSMPFIGLSSALALLGSMPGYRMVLFGPLSMLSYLHLAARQGILIKDGRSLESLQEVDTVVFDKTGTLTIEQPRVSKVLACPGFSRRDVLTFAAAAETRQSHPIARAILDAAAEIGLDIPTVDEADHHAGYGITTKVEGRVVRVGSSRYMDLNGIHTSEMIQTAEDRAHELGHSVVLIAMDGKLAGGIVLEPAIRKDAAETIRQLRARGLKMYIMSGDREGPTRHLAQELGMDYFSEVLPADKANLVRVLQAEGRKVCFIGDGINDSIALKRANVSVSMRGATTIAVDTAQIVLMEGSLGQFPGVFQLADEFGQNMRINLLASTVPCVVMVVGALFFGMTLLTSTLIYQTSIPFGLYNVVRPLFPRKPAPKQIEDESDIPSSTAGAAAPIELVSVA